MQSGTRIIVEYAALTIALVVAPLLVLTAVYLVQQLHKKRARLHDSPGSISTPYGYMSYEQARTEWPWGLERASNRDTYYGRGRN